MSTHCTISIQNTDVTIFKHHDGMPSNMVPLLEKIVADFFKTRGDEPDMLVAYVLTELRKDLDKDDSWNVLGDLTKTPKDKNHGKTGLRLFSKSEFQSEGFNYLINSKGEIFVNGAKIIKVIRSNTDK